MKKKCFVICCYLIACISLSAQIVNIEDKRPTIKDSIDWVGHVDLKFNLIQNGAQIISLNGDYRLEHVRYRHLFLFFGQYNVGRLSGDAFVDDGFQHIRYNYQVNKWLTWEAFTQLQYNELIQLRMRWLLGSGPRFQLYNKNKSRFFLGMLYMYEYNEERTKEDGPIQFLRDHRLSSYLSFRFQPSDVFTFAGTTYIQPVLNDFADIRISTQSTLLFKISSKLQYSTSFSLLYDSNVLEGVQQTIYKLTNGLRWNF